MDYNLVGLSSRSFEHLVQALTVKFVGAGSVVFGDGPDGGREASFTGRTSYDVGDGIWEGYVVVQAKFRQKPLGAPADGDWFLEQLTKELDTFTASARRQKPDYYIIATNVTLTPDQDRGSKDRALALLRSKAPYLRGMDIWDYDKLRVLLDQSREIRETYSAWITPGDVLHEIIAQLQGATPDFERTLSRFLQHETLVDQYSNLEQAGHSPDERVPMASVFVDLPVEDSSSEPPEEDEKFVASVLAAAADRLSPSCLASPNGNHTEISSSDGIQRGRVVLVGGPGQGKTTLGQFVCQLFRASLLLSRPEAGVDPEIRAIAQLVREWCNRDGYELPAARRFPLRIVLSELATALSEEVTIDSVLSFVADRIARRVSTALDADLLRKWLGAYPWLIVLDGLDEVPSSSNRDELLTAIRGLMIDIADSDADVLVIATTRPQGYSDEFSTRMYRHRSLVPLPREAALGYAERLAQVRFGENPERRDRVMGRLRAAVTNDTTARLMTSPLQVTIMTILVDRQGHPPQERWSLFSAYYKAIYDRELERDVLPSHVLRDQHTNVDAVHRRVGLLLQAEGEHAEGTDARLSVARFREVIVGRLLGEGFTDGRLVDVEKQLVEAASNRLVFLVGLESDRVGFEIRSLQEFMAAEGLMEGPDEEVRRRLAAIAPSPSWRNVFLFAAGKCFADRQHLRDTIHTICAEVNDARDPALAALLSGSRIAGDVLDEGTVRQQPKYALLFARLALRLLQMGPSDLDDRLAYLYDPSLERPYREEVCRVIGAADFEARLGAWRCLIALAARGVEWALAMCEENWPCDPTEGSLILRCLGEVPANVAVGALLGREILRHPVWESVGLMTPAMRAGRGGGPEWLRATAAFTVYSARSELGTVAAVPGVGAWSLRAESVDRTRMKVPDELAPLDRGHPSWGSVRAVLQFGKSPSAGAAADVVRAIAGLSNELEETVPTRSAYHCVTWAKLYFARMPWPIASLIFGASSTVQLEKWADEMEAGAFGSVDDWRTAEERWKTERYNLLDLLVTFDPDEPLRPGVFPLAAVNRIFPHQRVIVTDELMAAIESLASPAPEWAASIILQGMDLLSGLEEERAELSTDHCCRLVSLARSAPFPVSIAVFEKSFGGMESSPAIAECLETVGRSVPLAPFVARTPSPNVRRLAEEAIAESGPEPGLVKLLVLTTSSDHPPSLDVSACEGADDAEVRLAAVLLSLRPAEQEPSKVAERLASFVVNRPRLLEMVLEFLRRGGTAAAWTEMLLVEVLDLIPASGSARTAVLTALGGLVDRRMTPLADLARWGEFGLFEPPGV